MCKLLWLLHKATWFAFKLWPLQRLFCVDAPGCTSEQLAYYGSSDSFSMSNSTATTNVRLPSADACCSACAQAQSSSMAGNNPNSACNMWVWCGAQLLPWHPPPYVPVWPQGRHKLYLFPLRMQGPCPARCIGITQLSDVIRQEDNS